MRGQIKGTTTHRNEPTKHLDKTTEWKWPLLINLHTVNPTDESRRRIHHNHAKRISFGLCCLLFEQCKTYLYIALVTGPFGNLSSDFNLLVDFIARERAMQTMKLRGTNPALALAVHRRALVRRIGLLTSRGWAQHTVDRWHGAVKPSHSIAYH